MAKNHQDKDDWPHQYETVTDDLMITKEQDYTNEDDNIVTCDDNNDDTELVDGTVRIQNVEVHTPEGYISTDWFTNVMSGAQEAIVNTIATSSEAMAKDENLRIKVMNTCQPQRMLQNKSQQQPILVAVGGSNRNQAEIVLENQQLTAGLNQHFFIERQQYSDHHGQGQGHSHGQLQGQGHSHGQLQGHGQGQGVPIALSLPATVQRRSQPMRNIQLQANRQSLLKQVFIDFMTYFLLNRYLVNKVACLG